MSVEVIEGIRAIASRDFKATPEKATPERLFRASGMSTSASRMMAFPPSSTERRSRQPSRIWPT